jgi:hypothetical protein
MTQTNAETSTFPLSMIQSLQCAQLPHQAYLKRKEPAVQDDGTVR